MKSVLTRAIAEVCGWAGWTSLADARLTPAHGWLLREPLRAVDHGPWPVDPRHDSSGNA